MKREIKIGKFKKLKLIFSFEEKNILGSQKMRAIKIKIPNKICLLKSRGSVVKGKKKIGKRKTKR